MNDNYMTIPQFVECQSKIIGKIATYDILIEKFEEALLAGATSGHLVQYEMDDGQMKVRAQYRNVRDMTEAMNGLIKMRQYYVNKANGRSIRMVGGNL